MVGRNDHAPRIDLVPVEFIKTLVLKSYSPNTIRTYKSMLQEFLVYYRKPDPGKITEVQIGGLLSRSKAGRRDQFKAAGH